MKMRLLIQWVIFFVSLSLLIVYAGAQEKSEKYFLSEKGIKSLEEEQDLTRVLYFIFEDEDMSKRYPEELSLDIIRILGPERVYRILKKYDMESTALPGIVIGFQNGFREGKCLPKLKEEGYDEQPK